MGGGPISFRRSDRHMIYTGAGGRAGVGAKNEKESKGKSFLCHSAVEIRGGEREGERGS